MAKFKPPVLELPQLWRASPTRPVKVFRGIVGDYDPNFRSLAHGGTYFARHPAYAMHWTRSGTSTGNARKSGKPRLLMLETSGKNRLAGQDDSGIAHIVESKFRRAVGMQNAPKRARTRKLQRDLFGDRFTGVNSNMGDFGVHIKGDDGVFGPRDPDAIMGPDVNELRLLDDDVPHLYQTSDRFQELVKDASELGTTKAVRAQRAVSKYLKRHGRYSKNYKEMIRNGGIMGAAGVLTGTLQDD